MKAAILIGIWIVLAAINYLSYKDTQKAVNEFCSKREDKNEYEIMG